MKQLHTSNWKFLSHEGNIEAVGQGNRDLIASIFVQVFDDISKPAFVPCHVQRNESYQLVYGIEGQAPTRFNEFVGNLANLKLAGYVIKFDPTPENTKQLSVSNLYGGIWSTTTKSAFEQAKPKIKAEQKGEMFVISSEGGAASIDEVVEFIDEQFDAYVDSSMKSVRLTLVMLDTPMHTSLIAYDTSTDKISQHFPDSAIPMHVHQDFSGRSIYGVDEAAQLKQGDYVICRYEHEWNYSTHEPKVGHIIELAFDHALVNVRNPDGTTSTEKWDETALFKLIASSDSTIRKPSGEQYPEWDIEPQFNQSLINEYIEAYNDRRHTDDCVVNYVWTQSQVSEQIYELDVHSDNTVTAKLLQSSDAQATVRIAPGVYNIDVQVDVDNVVYIKANHTEEEWRQHLRKNAVSYAETFIENNVLSKSEIELEYKNQQINFLIDLLSGVPHQLFK